ncbi:cupin domain-containing protein [Streptomyces sp. NBC_00453]|uniref:cupin domain-containing protein n=1 Tax=Streptomyces sp. NBC_00453 TaxID=2903653 RepID=UPI002E251F97
MDQGRDEVRVARPGDRRPGPGTEGMDRQEAFATEGMWSGFVRTEPGAVSGWHHHGDHESVIYVVTGSLRMEFGPGGSRTVEAGPGDFLHVPKGAVHRESNPSPEPADIIVTRAGTGQSTFNVEGPAPD